ncbi:DrmB family protein [Robinsoniella peoriensis]|uniref:DrmB family protein n=1 Tax=Robinsoniella peoriensis TaxID=180332 RepID=UPI003639AA8D
MDNSNRTMRRSALIGPWGVGAIVPFPNDESLMIAGLDAWRYQNEKPFMIRDERLSKRLGVKELRWPPDFRKQNVDSVNYNLKIPAVRFPNWYYCPFCGYMIKTTYYQQQPECIRPQWETGRVCSSNGKYRRKMIPERFIVVCPEGHIDDFPIAEWIHFDSGRVYDKNTCVIRRSTGGASANLTGVFYECTCGAKKSMAGATTKGALKKIGYHCKGARPWLGVNSEDYCPQDTKDIKVMLRGATNVWFADTRSSIHIPTENDAINRKISGLIRDHYERLSSSRVNGEFNRGIIDYLAETEGIDPNILYQAFIAESQKNEGIMDVTEDMSEDQYRLAEYKVLVKTSGNDDQDFHSINYPVAEYNSKIHNYFSSISLVPKLRETRAMVGFSRLEPNEKPISEKKKDLRLGNEEWLPAIEVFGEGIFFEFNEQVITQWAQSAEVKSRIDILNMAYHKSNFGKRNQRDLRPEFVMIHTFAHLVINQLSFECGYGSSALRERIYCEKTSKEFGMYGVLIYTASGDSEGSLGGLVRQGEKGRLEDTIVNAFKNALWCTSDPICIQSSGQGPESLNLAACHNCALLPETCCENGNRILDRAVIVGTLEKAEIGFFHDLRDR